MSDPRDDQLQAELREALLEKQAMEAAAEKAKQAVHDALDKQKQEGTS